MFTGGRGCDGSARGLRVLGSGLISLKASCHLSVFRGKEAGEPAWRRADLLKPATVMAWRVRPWIDSRRMIGLLFAACRRIKLQPGRASSSSNEPKWRNWQTHGTQNPAPLAGMGVRPPPSAPNVFNSLARFLPLLPHGKKSKACRRLKKHDRSREQISARHRGCSSRFACITASIPPARTRKCGPGIALLFLIWVQLYPLWEQSRSIPQRSSSVAHVGACLDGFLVTRTRSTTSVKSCATPAPLLALFSESLND